MSKLPWPGLRTAHRTPVAPGGDAMFPPAVEGRLQPPGGGDSTVSSLSLGAAPLGEKAGLLPSQGGGLLTRGEGHPQSRHLLTRVGGLCPEGTGVARTPFPFLGRSLDPVLSCLLICSLFLT